MPNFVKPVQKHSAVSTELNIPTNPLIGKPKGGSLSNFMHNRKVNKANNEVRSHLLEVQKETAKNTGTLAILNQAAVIDAENARVASEMLGIIAIESSEVQKTIALAQGASRMAGTFANIEARQEFDRETATRLQAGGGDFTEEDADVCRMTARAIQAEIEMRMDNYYRGAMDATDAVMMSPLNAIVRNRSR